jgi:hypothetical protein
VPWSVKKDDRCPASKPWAVTNKDTDRLVGCHVSQDSARQQQKALYANVPESDRAVSDADIQQAIAAVDASIDAACMQAGQIDRDSAPAPVAQLIDLVVAADAACDQMMQCAGVSDPDDDAPDDGEQSLLGQALGLQYLVRFVHRDDGGPLVVGTFPSREAARDYLLSLEPLESDSDIWPITPPM